MMSFPNNLSILRRRAGYTQEGLAEGLGVSRQAVSKWESGLTLPEAATLPALADLLSCTLDELMRGTLTEEDLPPSPREEEAQAEALFCAYDAHMNRHAVMIAVGVALILLGVAALLAVQALAGFGGLSVLPLLLSVAVAVFLFIMDGGAHEDFQRRYPVIPDRYPIEERERFAFLYRLGVAASVSAIVLDAALLIGLGGFFDDRERIQLWVVALFMLILSGAVGTLVLMGVLEEKYDLEEYSREAQKLREEGASRE